MSDSEERKPQKKYEDKNPKKPPPGTDYIEAGQSSFDIAEAERLYRKMLEERRDFPASGRDHVSA